MNPSVKLHLIEVEMQRWLADERPTLERDRIHADRVATILTLDFSSSGDTRTRWPS
jgi:hypothetical protein